MFKIRENSSPTCTLNDIKPEGQGYDTYTKTIPTELK